MDSFLKQILHGEVIDLETGRPLALPNVEVRIEPSLAGWEVACLTNARGGKNLTVVCDRNTHEALGERVIATLRDSYDVRPLVFEEKILKPTIKNIERLQSEAASSSMLVAVGSGTINDLCKLASFQAEKPYVIFPTAPSMNGYLSANASILMEGGKQSLPAHLPAGVFCDLEVLAAAPRRLIQAGLGDSLCRSTCQADWLFSHYVAGTVYKETPFKLLKQYEDDLFASAGKLVKGYREAIELLMNTLLVSGIGMTISGGSYPASQGEHLIAHTMEMLHPELTEGWYHGEQIGVTTLTMARLQEALLQDSPLWGESKPASPRLRWTESASDSAHPPKLEDQRRVRRAISNDYSSPEIVTPTDQRDSLCSPAADLAPPSRGSDVLSHFGKKMGQEYLNNFHEKQAALEKADWLSVHSDMRYGEMSDALEKVMRPASELEAVLKAADALTSPEALNWPSGIYEQAVRFAPCIRDRLTFLDWKIGEKS